MCCLPTFRLLALVQRVAHSDATLQHSAVVQTLQGLDLPHDTMLELSALLTEPSALTQQGAPRWLEGIAARIGDKSWFLIAADSIKGHKARQRPEHALASRPYRYCGDTTSTIG